MNTNNTWSPATKIIVLVLLLLGALWLLSSIKPMLTALIMAALLAYLLDPVIQRLTRRTRLTRPAAARLVFVCLLLLMTAIPATLGAVAVEQFHNLEIEFFNAIAALEKWISQPIELLGYRLYPEIVIDNLEQAAGSALTSIPEESLNFLSDVTTNLLWVLLFFFGLYYLLKDGFKIIPWLLQMAPAEYQPDFHQLLDELNEVWGVFLRVQLLMFLILGILMGAGFLLVIWLFRSGLVPFSFLALILLLALVVIIAQQIDNLWLRPQLMGKSLHMHPGLVFAGLTGALMVGGLLAAFFVVPLMATAKVLGRYVYCQLVDLPPWQDDDDDANSDDEEESDPVEPLFSG